MSEKPIELDEDDIARLAASPAAALVVSLDRGELVWGNAAAARLLGLPAGAPWPAEIDRATPALAALEAAAATRSGLRLPQRLVFWRRRGAIALMASVRPIRLADASRAVLVVASEPSGPARPHPAEAPGGRQDQPARALVTGDPATRAPSIEAPPPPPARSLVLIPMAPDAPGDGGRRTDPAAPPAGASSGAHASAQTVEIGADAGGAPHELDDAAAMAAIARQIRTAASRTQPPESSAGDPEPHPSGGPVQSQEAPPLPLRRPPDEGKGGAERTAPPTSATTSPANSAASPRAALRRLLRRKARRHALPDAERPTETGLPQPRDRAGKETPPLTAREALPPARANGASVAAVGGPTPQRPRTEASSTRVASTRTTPALPSPRPAPTRRPSPWRPAAGEIMSRPGQRRVAPEPNADRPSRHTPPPPDEEFFESATNGGEPTLQVELHDGEPRDATRQPAAPPETPALDATDDRALSEYLLPLPIAAAIYGEQGCELANAAWERLFSTGRPGWADGWLRALADAARHLAGRAAVRTTEFGGGGRRLRCGARLVAGGKVMLLAQDLDESGEHLAATARSPGVGRETGPAAERAPSDTNARTQFASHSPGRSATNGAGPLTSEPSPSLVPTSVMASRLADRGPPAATASQSQSLRRIVDDALRCTRARADGRFVRLVRGAIATPAAPAILPLLIRQILIACIDRGVDAAGPEGRVTLSAGTARTSTGTTAHAELRISAQPSGAVIVFESPRASIPATYRIAEDLAAQCGVHLKLETTGPQRLDIVARIPMRPEG